MKSGLEYNNPSPTDFEDWRDFTILIAEDNSTCYLYLEFLLKDKVKRIDHAVNGEEAFELALKNNYDLILMDIKMPVMDGLEAAGRIKQQFPDTPVIAQTAYVTPRAKTEALQAGCDDYIAKPIKKAVLLETINRIMNKTAS